MDTGIALMNLFWSAAGIYPGVAEISPFDLKTRARSAAKAGFVGMGLWHTDLAQIRKTLTLAEIRAILDDNGIRHLELEFLEDWFVEGPPRAASDKRRRMLLEAAAVLGAHHVKVGDFHNTATPMQLLVEAFAALCEEARQEGATIGFEFMGSAMLNTLEGAREMVETAGAANGGLIVDIAHTVHLGISNAAVSHIPARHLVCVELNDNLLPATPGYDPGERRFCGEGEFDIAGFIAAVRATGYAGPWALEVFARGLAGLPLDDLNGRGYRTTMTQF